MQSGFISRRRFLSSAALAALAPRVSLLHSLAAISPITLRTPLGALHGEESGGVRTFRGIPFAEPPIGNLRFRPTVTVKPWTTPRDATHFAAAATQPTEHGATGREDCLYLNVWAPAAKGSYPVYVWIHGGGLVTGRSFDSMYDGTGLAREGIVCVTIAYRLGAFGFLDVGPLLGPEYSGSANNGVRDLIAALDWVKQNIEAFGGDPLRVTVGGQSAGAKLTGILMGVPSAKPLFNQMVSESGGAERATSMETSVAVSEGFGKLWRSGTNGSVSALATAPAASLIQTQIALMESWPHHFPLRAQIDGSLIPRRVIDTIAAGSTRGKKLLIGTNRDESAFFVGPNPAHDAGATDLANLESAQFLEVYGKYEGIYPRLTVEQRRIRALTAEEYLIPSVREVEAHLTGGGTAWMYRLDFQEGSGRLGAFTPHSLDVHLVWDRPSPTVAKAAAEIELAHQMHEAWCAFLRGNAPAAPGVPEWPRYNEEERRTMIFDDHNRVESHPQEAELRLWNKVL
jgi:para-nitrobenzyl esterase